MSDENNQSINESYVKQKDAALLRECLAWCFKNSSPSFQQKIFQTLKLYSIKVREYCICPEQADLGMGKSKCLDCGKEHSANHLSHEKNSVISSR